MNKKIKIILADDNEQLVQSMKKEFNKVTDFIIIGIAKNGEEELNMIFEREVDVVITDNDMPIYTGLEVIEKVKKEKANSPIFILVSGENKPELMKKAIDLGVYRCFIKPLDMQKIINEIKILFISLDEEDRIKLKKKNGFLKKMFFKKDL